jgi:hypothetical protein
MLAGGVAAYESLIAWNTLRLCPLGGCPYSFGYDTLPEVIAATAILLAVAGVLCLWGMWVATWAGVAFAAVSALGMLGEYWTFGTSGPLIGAIVCLGAAVVSLIGTRSTGGMTEQQNPMNLPVFG